jgi:hypothetical protein
VSRKLTFFPVTDTTQRALKFIDSPFIQLQSAILEAGEPGQLTLGEQAKIVLERCRKRLTTQWRDPHVTVFCLTCEPQRLEILLSGTPEKFEAAARREILDALPEGALSGLVSYSLLWFVASVESIRNGGDAP